MSYEYTDSLFFIFVLVAGILIGTLVTGAAATASMNPAMWVEFMLSPVQMVIDIARGMLEWLVVG